MKELVWSFQWGGNKHSRRQQVTCLLTGSSFINFSLQQLVLQTNRSQPLPDGCFFSTNFLHRLIGAAHANSCSCWLPFQGLQERCYRGFPEPLLSLVLVSSFSQESYQLIPVINTPLFWDSQWVCYPTVNPELIQTAAFCESLLCAARSYVLPSILYQTLFYIICKQKIL